jgi:hypothetical protein
MVGPNRVCALKCIGSAGSAVISQFYSDLCPEHDQWVFAKRHPGPYCCPLLDAQYHEVLHAASRCVVPCAQPKPLERWYTFLFAALRKISWSSAIACDPGAALTNVLLPELWCGPVACEACEGPHSSRCSQCRQKSNIVGRAGEAMWCTRACVAVCVCVGVAAAAGPRCCCCC